MSESRKRRRLSYRQALACETAPRGSRTECRCQGRCRGLNRVSAKPSRWDFAALDRSDPHFIPALRRRISPRVAAHIVASKIKALAPGAKNLKAAAQQAARNFPHARPIIGKLLGAFYAVCRTVRDDREYIDYRRKRSYRLAGRWNVVNLYRPERKKVNQPLGMIENILAWLMGDGHGPPGAPRWGPAALDGCLLPVLQARLELQREQPAGTVRPPQPRRNVKKFLEQLEIFTRLERA